MATSNGTAKRRTGRKRGHGEGSIRQRKPGLWAGEIMVGHRPDGSRDRRTVYGKTRAEVVGKLDQLRQQRRNGMLPDAEVERDTVGSFLTRWLQVIRAGVRERTWQRYAELTRLHLIPVLGHLQLGRLHPDHVQALYAAKLDGGLAPQTVVHLHRVLHVALSHAVKRGYLHRNVTDAVDPPSVQKREMQRLTPEEAVQLLDSAAEAGDRLTALWTLAVYSGCRQGELLGLKWEDLDWEEGTITIRRTLITAVGGVPSFSEPKTGRSRRTLTPPDEALAALRAHRARQNVERLRLGPDYTDYGLIFATRLGTALQARNVIRAYKAALRRADLSETLRFHDLRHTTATLLLAAGVDVATTAAVLGHSQASTTLNVYAHVLPSNMTAAAMKLQRKVRGAA